MSHHPDFVRFSSAYRQQDFDRALGLADSLIAEIPGEPWLHWHRANCLEKLERFDEMLSALDAALALDPQFARAIIKRVQFTGVAEEEFDEDDDEALPTAERERRERAYAARMLQDSLDAEAELRRALALEPDNVDGLKFLAGVLRHRDGADAAQRDEADALLDRAIALAPGDIELLETRAQVRRSEALLAGEGTPPGAWVQTFSGLRYSRPELEAALADYERCFALSGSFRHAVRMGTLLHDLARFDEALARYDQALALMPTDDPARRFIEETRARSENQGAGERDQLARLLESAVPDDGADRTLADDMAAQAILGAARAVRAGQPLEAAIGERIGDDPDTLVASSIAQQILNVAHEPPPQLEAVLATAYPAYQRSFVETAGRKLARLGLRPVADGEAKGLFPMLGQHVLIRFFADDSGEVGVAAFALRPKWPGWAGFLALLLGGKWKTTTMVECVTHFDDGALLCTQHENPSPFEYGGAVQIERLPRSTSLERLVAHHLERVAAHKLTHPASVAMVADDLAGLERRWLAGQRAKREYRASIGYVTEAELERMLGTQHGRFGDKVRSQVAVLAAGYR
jgi:tetratricopeptide (TPR) repeat protein